MRGQEALVLGISGVLLLGTSSWWPQEEGAVCPQNLLVLSR